MIEDHPYQEVTNSAVLKDQLNAESGLGFHDEKRDAQDFDEGEDEEAAYPGEIIVTENDVRVDEPRYPS